MMLPTVPVPPNKWRARLLVASLALGALALIVVVWYVDKTFGPVPMSCGTTPLNQTFQACRSP